MYVICNKAIQLHSGPLAEKTEQTRLKESPSFFRGVRLSSGPRDLDRHISQRQPVMWPLIPRVCDMISQKSYFPGAFAFFNMKVLS